MRKQIDLTHQRFGKLTVIWPSETRTKYWSCKCDCGKELEVRSDSLRQGRTKSCGCNKKKGNPKSYRTLLVEASTLGLLTETDPHNICFLETIIDTFRRTK